MSRGANNLARQYCVNDIADYQAHARVFSLICPLPVTDDAASRTDLIYFELEAPGYKRAMRDVCRQVSNNNVADRTVPSDNRAVHIIPAQPSNAKSIYTLYDERLVARFRSRAFRHSFCINNNNQWLKESLKRIDGRTTLILRLGYAHRRRVNAHRHRRDQSAACAVSSNRMITAPLLLCGTLLQCTVKKVLLASGTL